MKLLPVQAAAAVVGVISAIVLTATVVLGAALLPEWANFALIVATVALIVVMVARFRRARLRTDGLKGLFRALRAAMPAFAIVLVALAFYGGWLIALVTMVSGSTAGNLKYENGQYTTTHRKTVTVLTKEQYEDAQAANQRLVSAICLAMSGGVFGLSGVAERIRETR
jgi:hypothetical protein